MGLTVLTAAPVTALVEVATCRSRLGLTSSSDALLTELVDEMTSAIVSRIGRDVVRQRYRETLPETGRQRLLLRRRAVDPDSVTVTINGTALTSTEFSVEDAAQGVLFREAGWGAESAYVGQDAEETIGVTYKAGRLVPESSTRAGVVTTWAAATAYVAGAWVRPASLAQASPLRFECTTAGTSHASTEPTWPTSTTTSPTVTDGTVVWTARQAEELPKALRSCAWLAVQDAYTRLTRQAGLASRSGQGYSESYFAPHTESELPPNVLRTIDQLRTWL